ncbi:MAG TPA: hexapeptide transferase [Clostridiales bacterium]|nr:hexapeptide transferase [Clostridiales bacterium]
MTKVSEKSVVVVGGGGHARSVLDIALSLPGLSLFGCVNPFGRDVLGVPCKGTEDDLEKIYAMGIRYAFVAIGENAARNEVYDRIVAMGFEPVTIVSPYAVVSERAALGKGVCVMPGAVIHVNAVIGDNCIVNTNCSIDHDCKIGKSCHIAPGVSMSGTVCVGDGAHIGTGASVIDNITIGARSYIGAGAAVVKNITNDVLAVGVPARVIKYFKSEGTKKNG